MNQRIPYLAALAFLLAAGCSRQPRDIAAAKPAPGLQPITFEAWQEKLVGARGTITVVDFWASWCAPCLERFPHMVALHERYKESGVRFVSVSLDDRDDKGAIEQARSFLARQNAAFENYLMDENITDAFQKLDLLSIPAVLIYGRDGRLRYKLTGDDPNRQFTNEDVDRAIETLLGETG
ncbi:MAG: resA 13 [Acidobacteria bacterium]|jgi:thiol-disulfide isomerase/thioredoxin|nr:resA 13 [Acidobacteriota bacterium]